MTNEQCIEVAEKVWGWEKDVRGIEPNVQVYYGHPLSSILTKQEVIKEKVLSWQGFGRTVEVMAEKDNVIVDEIGKHYIDYILGRTSKEQLWGRTQTAALEALK